MESRQFQIDSLRVMHKRSRFGVALLKRKFGCLGSREPHKADEIRVCLRFFLCVSELFQRTKPETEIRGKKREKTISLKN